MRLSEIFADNMVLQRGKYIAIFGYGSGKGNIEFCGKKTEFQSERERFCVYLSPEEAGGPYDMHITLNGEEVILTNILVGDVYIAAGQSNMELPLRETVDIEKTENKNIRVFTEPHDIDVEMKEMHGEAVWSICDAENILDVTAIGYDVAFMLNRELEVPIGIISCNKGATRVEAWTAPEIVEMPMYQEWITKKHLDYDLYRFNHNSWPYLNKLLSIVPFTVNGILWYQGESNRRYEEAIHYDKMLAFMIQNWRDLWKEELPFFLVQIMPYDEEDADWAAIRKAQETVSKEVEQVYLATLVHTEEEKEIHPKKKHKVGIMLANAILHALFGYDTVYCGPVLRSYRKCDTFMEISFDYEEGLHFRDSDFADIFLYDNNNLKYPAICEIVNQTLIIINIEGKEIKKVTMGYSNAPKHQLYNAAGFLASPFEIVLDARD